MAKHGTLPEFLYQRHLEVSDKVHLNFGFHEDEDLNEDEACEEADNSDALMKARTNSMKAVTKTLTSVPMQTSESPSIFLEDRRRCCSQGTITGSTR